ncbi:MULTISPECIES: aspartate/glutamate racemase family protein [unclassified Saccharicrinis]|uniref:aspartate/glutamate racemase family protein n=1 Tax=unclassified Saccharicrinis TaxID=2646859 RepID=UPI003D32E611
MKTIGILGGLGPEATVDYYKEIIKGFDKINGNGSLNYPEIVLYSVTMSRFIGLLEEDKYDKASDYLADCLNGIKNAGADFAVLSANTPHLLFNEIQGQVDLPLISILEVCAQKAQSIGAERCGLLGTKFTMQKDFYQKVFQEYNIEIFVPDEQQVEFIHSKLFDELELGIFKEKTKQELLEIVEDLKEKQRIDAVILGCTEFPLMFTEDRYLNLPFLNTTCIHVNAIINECLKSENNASEK